jgi:hypothetical protein
MDYRVFSGYISNLENIVPLYSEDVTLRTPWEESELKENENKWKKK